MGQSSEGGGEARSIDEGSCPTLKHFKDCALLSQRRSQLVVRLGSSGGCTGKISLAMEMWKGLAGLPSF